MELLSVELFTNLFSVMFSTPSFSVSADLLNNSTLKPHKSLLKGFKFLNAKKLNILYALSFIH